MVHVWRPEQSLRSSYWTIKGRPSSVSQCVIQCVHCQSLSYDCICVPILAELQRYSANSHAVFANSEFSLKYINVYGFDFDYTLAQYSKELHKFIYQQARDLLIKKLNVS